MKKWAVWLGFLMFSKDIYADDNGRMFSFTTGNDLVNYCTSAKPIPAQKEGVCLSYVMGAADMLGKLQPLAEWNWVCLKPGVTPDQLNRVVAKYLADRPAMLNHDASFLVMNALIDAFPCPSK